MDVEQIFKREGPLSKYWPNYIPRPGQIALAKAVESSLRDNRPLLAEGPCGTGKSLAYGIPAAIFVLTEECSVAIATANIALQEQLIKKDLPLIANVMRDVKLGDLKFFSRKGMNNYICLYKLEEVALEEKEPWAKELRKWVNKYDQGDKEELPVDYHDKWPLVSSSRDECAQDACRFYDSCYAYRSRRATEAAENCIVVTNYHLLYADSAVRDASSGHAHLLPEYRVTIADECHSMVDIARGFQGFEQSMGAMWWLIRRLSKLVKTPKSEEAIVRLRENAREFFEDLIAFYQSNKGTILKKPLGFGKDLISSLHECGALSLTAAIKEEDREKTSMLYRLCEYIDKKAYQLESVCYGRKIGVPSDTPTDLDLFEGVLDPAKKEAPESEVGELDDGAVYYVEYSGRGQSARLCSQMIEVQDFIREGFLGPTTLIATSATLSTNGNFDFIAKELGLDPDEYSSLIAPSPFSPKNMLVVVPTDFPSPKDRQSHIQAMSKSIEETVSILGGRSMVLFTSYSSLEAVSEYLDLRLPGVDLLVQGKLPRGKIVEGLRNNEKSLILATASFWQGIDIPGRSLSCLFIEKFPFAPPTDPVVSYMEQMWARKTGDKFSSFMNYSVPKAVIALKQGVGRLIRQESDYGAVVLFDTRLETKNYGVHFESAFPVGHYRSGNLSSIPKFIFEQDARLENVSLKQ